MNHVLIVEDDLKQLEMLKKTVTVNFPTWDCVGVSNYEQAVDVVDRSLRENCCFTLFLLDVQLSVHSGDRGGFFLAKEIRKHPPYYKTPLLFLTAVSDEVYFALSEFHCYNYIPKPYTEKDIINQIQQLFLTGYLYHTVHVIDINRIVHHIFVRDILYIEAISHTVIIHLTDGIISTRAFTLETITEQLGESIFRCHRHYSVNLDFVKNYDRACHYLSIDGKAIPVSKRRQSMLENCLLGRT